MTNKREDKHVLFNTCVHAQTPLRELGRDAVVVIEFKHYKPKKKKVSTKCWGFFSVDELDPSKESQRLALEVYAKPTDLRCKKINLLSVKQLVSARRSHLADGVTVEEREGGRERAGRWAGAPPVHDDIMY